jgi:CelD/BcsL family acetyltransferase involved in cellulose biosynthesis
MSRLRILTLTSADELLRHAAAWDDLWRRSQVALPTLQAECLALWLRQFAPRGGLHALVVEESGQFVAALPLVGRRLKGLVTVASLTNNAWSPCGDLLLDESCDVPAALDVLAAAAAELPQALLWLEAVDGQSARWQAWQAAATRAGLTCDVHRIADVGVVDAAGGWDGFTGGLSADFRRNLRRRTRHLEEAGTLALGSWNEPAGQSSRHAPRAVIPRHTECADYVAGQALASALQTAFEIEDRGWKGRKGTSILRTPGLAHYFARQAELLAARGQLALHFLTVNGEPIAFEYGYLGKGTYLAHKIGYLPEHQKAAPGHVLRWHVLGSLFEQPGFRGLDFFGPLTDAARRWMTGHYTVCRLVVCPRRALSRTLMAAYTRLWPRVRRWRAATRDEPGVTS